MGRLKEKRHEKSFKSWKTFRNKIMEKLKKVFQNLDVDNEGFNNYCASITEDIKNNEYSILSLVEGLKEYLTAEEALIRSKGLLVLSNILEKLPNDVLNSEQLSFLCMYYEGKLKDHSNVIPAALSGIQALLDQKQVTEESYSQFLQGIFLNVSCQAQNAQVRYKIYTIFQKMLDNKPNVLIGLGANFILGVISAMDGERDPSNLLFLFKWLPKFIKTVHLEHLNEEMFDVISCYFPVDFRVPSEFANGVSRDALAEELAPCLVASEDFAEFCLPLIAEKLESKLQNAQLDSLKLLLLSLDAFPKSAFDSLNYFMVLRTFLIQSENYHDLALQAVAKLATKISEQVENTEFLENNFNKMQNGLTPNHQHFEINWKFLLALTGATEKTSLYLNAKIQPTLLNIFNLTTKIEQQIVILKVLCQFVKVDYSYNNAQNEQFLLLLLTVAQQNAQLLDVSLEIFAELSNYIPLEIRNQIYVLLKQLIMTRRILSSDDIFKKCLSSFAHYYSGEINEKIINPTGENMKTQNLDIYLWNLSNLLENSQFTNEFLKQLEISFENKRTLSLISLRNALKTEGFHEKFCQHFIIVDQIMNIEKFSLSNAEDKATNRDVLMKLMTLLTIEQQRFYIEKYLKKEVGKTLQATENYLDYYTGFIANLKREVLEDFGLLKKLFITQEINATKLFSNMINKLPNELIDNTINDFFNVTQQGLQNLNPHLENIILWITKALVMRGHKQQDQWINLLFQYVKVSPNVSQRLKIITQDDDFLLSTLNNCQQRLFYKQYFFEKICTKINENFDNLDTNLFVAFGSLLINTPFAVIKKNLEHVIKLILLTMEKSSDASSLLSILQTIDALIESKEQVTVLYFSDFLLRLQKLGKFQNMKVRMLALKCIGKYADENFIELHKLLPQKSAILHFLGTCLDDHKRLVRKEAVDARLKWYLLGAPI